MTFFIMKKFRYVFCQKEKIINYVCKGNYPDILDENDIIEIAKDEKWSKNKLDNVLKARPGTIKLPYSYHGISATYGKVYYGFVCISYSEAETLQQKINEVQILRDQLDNILDKNKELFSKVSKITKKISALKKEIEVEQKIGIDNG